MNNGSDKKNRIQDVLVLFSLLILSTILILGLLPREKYGTTSINTVFFNIVMMIPVIIAVYFIVISFRRRVSRDLYHVSTTIRTKLMLALLFAAIVPTLPITLISNNIINRTLSELFNQNTQESLTSALDMSRSVIDGEADTVVRSARLYGEAADSGIIDMRSEESSRLIRQICTGQGVGYSLFEADTAGYYNSVRPVFPKRDSVTFVEDFISLVNLDEPARLYRVKYDDRTYVLSFYRAAPYVAVFYRMIPASLFKQELNFEKSKVRYEQQTFIMPHIQDAVGLVLLVLSIIIIIMSVALSFFLAQSITRPVYKLVDASRRIAAGDFSIRLQRSASDEMSLLFKSYNEMAEKLTESRKIMMHNQRLEIWKEVGSKLLHEIKNPLTPIRLSAERIRRKYDENAPNLHSIIKSGTETIIEEVDILRHILGEFSKYTRMPEPSREYNSINQIIQNSCNTFQGHENITFSLHLDDDIPDIFVDRILIRQMMHNIIKNAIEAMSGAGTVFIRSRLDGDMVEIRIADTGPGISREDIDHLFDTTFSRKSDGTGLGLAIVERTVVKHGGTIECSSVPGRGAEFIIRLPAQGRDNGTGSDS